MFRCRPLLLGLAVLVLFSPAAHAHPVPRSSHDRKVEVQFIARPDGKPVVVVRYRLEVDELTVLLEDMVPFYEEVDPANFRNRRDDFYKEYTSLYAPILAAHLVARIDDRPLTFDCTGREHHLRDEKGEELGHLRCDFVFEAEAGELAAGPHTLTFRESFSELKPGLVQVALTAASPVRLLEKVEAPAELKDRPHTEWGPGDEEKLRSVSGRFEVESAVPVASPEPSVARPVPAPQPVGRQQADGHTSGLLALFRDPTYSYPVLLLLAAFFGAAHALTPGHGKTLVAAYLVGQRGTVWHALALGLVTTFTHTAVVLALALVLFVVPMDAATRDLVQSGLGLAMGLLVVCLGFWLLLQRVSGRADHVHIGGGHHHHHHDHHGHHHQHGHHHHDHTHDGHGHAVPLAGPGWWGLVMLGVSGGLVPCWDAIALLVVAIAGNLFHLALPLVLAFSAGLAGVLVLIGVLVVKVNGFAGSRLGSGAFTRLLPVASAAFIIAVGFWLCYDAVHGTG